MNEHFGNISTVISGSYRRHLAEMFALKSYLEQKAITVLSPVGTKATNPGEEFILLDADPIQDRRLLQDSIFAKMRRSTFLVVLNKDRYLGNAALLEIGHAIALGLRVLTLEPVDDPNVQPYTQLLREIFVDLPSF